MSYLVKELQNVGLSDKEARVYLAALELGAAPVQSISVKAAVNRATTYVMIESLIERGLMTTLQKGKKRLFVAESADNIIALLNAQKQRFFEKEESIKKILPDLERLVSSSAARPQVLFFEGRNGIERLRESVLKSEAKIVEEFSPIDEVYKFFPPSEKDHRKIFRERKKIKFIYASKTGISLPAHEKNVERRSISPEKYPFDGDIAIYGSKVNIIYYSPKLLGVLIDHEGIANTFHQLFTLAWESLDKRGK